jgi:hypothetical protein
VLTFEQLGQIHRVVMEYLQDKRQIIKPNLLLLIQEGIQRKRSRYEMS